MLAEEEEEEDEEDEAGSDLSPVDEINLAGAVP